VTKCIIAAFLRKVIAGLATDLTTTFRNWLKWCSFWCPTDSVKVQSWQWQWNHVLRSTTSMPCHNMPSLWALRVQAQGEISPKCDHFHNIYSYHVTQLISDKQFFSFCTDRHIHTQTERWQLGRYTVINGLKICNVFNSKINLSLKFSFQ